mmetsp:Transcript_17792/g.37160  ORF Transcript_17792/g.37160 Transcript_17792/m.37160 type:complete len:296 (-) Transcript_17792:53-940(-)
MNRRSSENISRPSADQAKSNPAPAQTPSGEMDTKLSPQSISRHLPPSSVGEVLPGLWVGNLMSVSNLAHLVKKSTQETSSNISNESKEEKKAIVTVISILSNKTMIRFVVDALAQQRLQQQHSIMGADISHNNKNNDCRWHNQKCMDIKHVIIPLKDTVHSDLLSVLPNVLSAIDDALGRNTDKFPHRDDDVTIPTTSDACTKIQSKIIHDNTTEPAVRNDYGGSAEKICLVHCAKGASRSVSVLIAYLLSRHPHRFKNFEEALGRVRSVQSQALPNIGFALSLRRFGKELRMET